jgi:hypothetical protein
MAINEIKKNQKSPLKKIGRGYQQQNAGVFDTSAGILEQSMGARNRVGIGLSNRPARLHRLAGRYDISFPTRGS